MSHFNHTALGAIASFLLVVAAAQADVSTSRKGDTLKIQGDAQNDAVNIDGLGAIGAVAVKANGGNQVTFVGVRNVFVSLAGGNDELQVSTLQIGGTFNAKLGSGDDQAFINDDGIVEGSVLIGRDLDVSLGGQTGDLCIVATTGDGPILVGRNCVIRGAADLKIEGEGGTGDSDALDIYVGGDLRIQTAVAGFVTFDDLTLVLDDVNVGGRTRITLGGAADAVQITNVRFVRDAELKLGGGDDVLDFGDQNTSFDATLAVDGGGGSDVLHHVTKLTLAATPKLKKLEVVEALP